MAAVAVLALAPAPATAPAATTYDTLHTPLARLAPPVAQSLGEVVPVGDFDGDGRRDLALLIDNSRGFNPVARYRVVIVSRRGPRAPARLDLKRHSTIDLGRREYAPTISAAGDFDGDGMGDIAFSDGPRLTVLRGARGSTHVALRSRGARVVRVRGLEPERGQDAPVAAPGDVDGDGRDELAVGSAGASPAGRAGAGSVYLVRGRSGVRSVDVRRERALLARLDGPAAELHAGAALVSIGDFDGDGHGDLAVGADRRRPAYGRDTSWVTPAGGASRELGGPGDTEIVGVGGDARNSLRAAGDLDGDGRADLGAARSGTTESSYVVYGAPGGGKLDVHALGERGVRFRAHGPPEAVGDVNGGGRSDVRLGDGVLLGEGERLPQYVDRRALAARSWNFDLANPIPVGDTDGDGSDDLVAGVGIGVPCWDTRGSLAFLPGGPQPPEPPEHARATPGADRLSGSRRGDVIDGERGNDHLSGRGGDDCITGGGDDVFEYDNESLAPRPDFDQLFGGRGRDELVGGVQADLLEGGPGDDRLFGGSGRDTLSGGPGDDLIVGFDPFARGWSRDRYSGGAGNDRINARDGGRQTVDCGGGRDRAVVDSGDPTVGCEDVRRSRRRG